MKLSPQMKLKMEKIDSLIDKGYALKTQLGSLIPNLVSPQGKSINTYIRKYGDDPLAGFSWIAFFFASVFATQIRHWSFFWFIGISTFLLNIFIAIPFDIDLTIASEVGFGIFYGFTFPYQKWLFLKSNKKEIGLFKSIIFGLLLAIVAGLPSTIIYSLYPHRMMPVNW